MCINDITEKGFKNLKQITPEEAPKGSLIVLYKENSRDFEVIQIEAIEPGINNYKIYFARRYGKSLISSDLTSYYYKVLG